MTSYYLLENRPAKTQFRARRDKPNGVMVLHTAESYPDEKGPDTGAENVARFIENRNTYGSYHTLADSDSVVPMIPFHLAAYGDGTGSNEWAIHLSLATQAHMWPRLSDEWIEGAVLNLARAAAQGARWLKNKYGIVVPARRITRTQSEKGVPGFISHADRDPSRRSDPGPNFPWDLFFREYRRLMAPAVLNIRHVHVSMQFSDNARQVQHDAKKMFTRLDASFFTGTEAAHREEHRPLQQAAVANGYAFTRTGNTWVAVNRDIIVPGSVKRHTIQVLKPNEGKTPHGRRDITMMSFEGKNGLGPVTVAAGHYLVKGARPGDPNYKFNVETSRAIGRAARTYGRGVRLFWYGGDQNMNDQRLDTFIGQPLTSAADELKKWPGTGHGPIDVSASYNADARVRAARLNVLRDKQFFLHTDHFVVVTDYSVGKLKAA